MASRRDLDKYQRAQGEIDRLCRRELRAIWARLAPVIGDDPAAVRDALVEVVQALCVKYGDLASTAAADWYDDLRAKNTGLPPYAAQTTSPVSPAAVEGTVRYAAGELWGDDPAKTRAMVETALARWNRYAGRDTILHNVGRDPAHPAWARVPRGAKTCAYCTMLASRGWAYSSEDAAARSGHDNCDCQIVPDWEAKKHILEGYDPDRLYDQYQVAHQSVLDEGGTADEESVLAAMRELFPTQYTDGSTGKVKGSSADGTLSAQHYRQRRQRLAADLAAMPEAERRGKKLPPSLPPEAPTADQWPDTLPALTAARVNHILYSDARGGGHLHGYGWINGGDEFPASWTVDDVLAAAQHVIATGVRGTRVITGTYRGVTLKVAYTQDRIFTITPVSGRR